MRSLWRRAIRRLQKLDRSTKLLLGCGIAGSAMLAWIVVTVAQ